MFQVLLLCAVFAAVLGCASDKEERINEARASEKLGHAFLMEGRYARALNELYKADKLLPDDPEIIHTLGLAYWARKDYAFAEVKFKRAVELKPDYSEAWNNLGALYLDQERYHEAIPAFEKALSNIFYSTTERALANLGWAFYKTGRLAEAVEKLTEALEIAPNFILAHRHMGVVLQDQTRCRQAVAHFDEVIRLYPDDPETHLRRGECLLNLDDRDGAREAFTEAWKLGAGSDIGKTAKTYVDLLE